MTQQHTLKPEGIISIANAEDFRTELRQTLENGVSELTIDLESVDMIDSTGLSVFVQCHQSLSERGGSLTVIAPADNIRNLFAVMGLDEHFTVRDAA